MKIYNTIKETSFTAKSKASGRVVNFASQQNRDDAVKSGEYEETDDAAADTTPAKPKVNIFDKPTQQSKPASDGDGEAKPPMKAKNIVKNKTDILKSKITKWSDKEKAFFRDGIHKENSPERRNWKDAIKDKAKGAITAIKKGAKHEVHEFKEAGKGVQNFFSGKPLSDDETKALKAVGIKIATTALFAAGMGGLSAGVAGFSKLVAVELIPHVVAETILKGAGKAALFADADGEAEIDANMEKFMQIIADKMASEKITPELMTKMVDSYNAKKGEGDSVNEEKVYIDYLNKAKGFKQDRIKFNSYEEAVKWAKKNFDKFDRDMIKYESVNEEVTELTPDQSEMVQGIIDMLLQIDDIDNRMKVAQQQIQNFKDEEIVFNYAWFLSAAGLDNNDEPVRMDVKTQPQHIINKESIMIGKINEDFKHIIHVETPTQVISKPIAAQILALAKKGVRSKDIGLEMGFVGNAKLAADAFQKVKNKIYFELGKKNESVEEATHTDAPGAWVAFLSMTRGKKLLKTFDTARGAKQYLSKNVDKLLGVANVESVGIMTKKQWDEREAKYAIESVNEANKSGDKLTHKHNPNIEIELIEPTNKGWKVYQIEKGKKKIAYFDKQDVSGDRALFESVNEEDTKSPEETLASLKKMAMGDLERIEDYAEMISDRMKEGQELSAWMYSQITLAVDQLNAVHDTMDGNDGIKESTSGEQIQNLNNRLTKLRQDMAKAKSPEAKNVIQARMKNALQKLSDKKKDMGIKKP